MLAELDALERAGVAPEDLPEAWELRAQACYATGRPEQAVECWEELHALHLAREESAAAARAAAMVAVQLLIDSGLMSPVRGWLRRAARLVEDQPDAPAHAIVAMVRAYERFFCGDTEQAWVQARLAVATGERLGVRPAVVVGRTAQARLRICAGEVEEGLELLDEVAVDLVAGDLDALTSGMMLCELVCAAQGVGRYDRAREWTALMDQWRHGRALGGFHGRCRVHRAELLRLSGPGEEAEAEAAAACDELRPWMRREYGWPLVELGTIRLRRGDLTGAEEALLAAHALVWCPHPALAQLRLAQGRVEEAGVLIADAIAHPLPVPWKERPPVDDLRIAPLLEAQAQIAAAAGDAALVADAAAALTRIAERYAGPGLTAAAALARARAALAAGVPAETEAARAVAAYADAEAPYETATAREVLAEAHAAAGAHDLATDERRAALAAFESFGAVRDVARVTESLVGTPATPSPSGTPGGAPLPAVFARVGGSRRVALGGRERLLPDLKGFRYLERLLAQPGREVHVVDLVGAEAARSARPHEPAYDDGLGGGAVGQSGLPVLDEQARRAYRRRLVEVEEDIADAEADHDPARVELARRDRQFLVDELSAAVGLGGRDRLVGGTSERARTSVARSVRYALGRLEAEHPALAAHLARSVRTGTYCCYESDPLTPVTWQLTSRRRG